MFGADGVNPLLAPLALILISRPATSRQATRSWRAAIGLGSAVRTGLDFEPRPSI